MNIVLTDGEELRDVELKRCASSFWIVICGDYEYVIPTKDISKVIP